MTPKELATAVKDVLMSKPNKGVIFPSFLTGVEDRGKFIEHCITYLDGVDSSYYERIQTICQGKIDALIKKEIEKEEAAIKFSTQRLAELKKKIKGE